MELVMFVPKENYPTVNREIYGDDLVSRQSVSMRDNTSLNLAGKEGYYLYVSGSEEAIKRAEEIVGERGEKLEGEEAEKIISLIKDSEEKQAQGFGAIFGD